MTNDQRRETNAPAAALDDKHALAESKIEIFSFRRPDVPLAEGKKFHVKLAGSDACRASVQILNKGGENNLHYHSNLDLIYMVLQGRVAFYGPGDELRAELAMHEGILLPENSRYWFKAVGEEEALLLQIAGYPHGIKNSRRIALEPAKETAGGKGGHWIGLTPEEERLREQ